MAIRMIVDTANVLFRVAAANGKYNTGTPEEKAGLAMHIALQSLNRYYRKFKPDHFAVTFEGADNWRKTYTKSEQCKSGKVYKANRVKDPSMLPFFELITSFEELARAHTSLVCLSNAKLEGDDLFAGYVQRFTEQGDTVIGISGDKDFVQLLKHPNFTLIDPASDKARDCDDADFFMFEKCFRGDAGDNVASAYPRVFKKRLLSAFADDYEKVKIMNESWKFTDPETGMITEHSVGDLFQENKLLMDLTAQPEDIKQLITETLDHECGNHGKFSFFQFTKFCGKFGLSKIAENAQQFSEMLSADGSKSSISPTVKKQSLMQF